jgi:hypothetical protein
MKIGLTRTMYDLDASARLRGLHVSRLRMKDQAPPRCAGRVPAPQASTEYERLRRDPEVLAALARVPRVTLGRAS